MAQPMTDDFNKWAAGKKGAAAKSRKGPARDFRVEKADNGFISYANHDVTPGTEKMRPYGMDIESMQTRKVHPTIKHAADHMIALFGGGGGKVEEEPKQPKTPEKAASDKKKAEAEKD
jgi:hypothetical protein